MLNQLKNTAGKFFLIFLINIFSLSLANAKCKITASTIIQASNPEECSKKIEDFGEEYAVSYIDRINFNKARSSCIKRVMNKEVDVMLKTLDKTEFKKQMQIQGLFNKGVKNYCDQYDKCEGPPSEQYKASCFSFGYKYRYNQVKQINTKTLKIEKLNPKDGFQESLFPPEFKNYIEGVCSLNDIVWSDKKPPKNCIELLKNRLMYAGIGYDVCDMDDGYY